MEQAIFAFPIVGNPVSCQEYGSGHINRTLKVDTDTGNTYILQKINKFVKIISTRRFFSLLNHGIKTPPFEYTFLKVYERG